MKEVTVSGKSVDEALALALDRLRVARDQVDVEVLEEPKKGLFGFIGSRPATIRVAVKTDPVQEAADYLLNIARKITGDASIDVQELGGREYVFNIKTSKQAILIGKKGQTLNALQYLVNLLSNQHAQHRIRIVVDVGDYRQRRKEALENLAHRSAERVERTRHAVKLEAMPSFERKIVHNALLNHPSVTTRSVGEEPNRSVVIDLKEALKDEKN